MKNYGLKFKMIFAFCIAIFIFAFSFLTFGLWGTKKAGGSLDGFAQCLASRKITMYGADWCPHCQSEKKAFGSSFKYVSYVECPDEPQKCIAAGINGYPTWVFPDGRKLEGEQGTEKLSQESGCPLRPPAPTRNRGERSEASPLPTSE